MLGINYIGKYGVWFDIYCHLSNKKKILLAY